MARLLEELGAALAQAGAAGLATACGQALRRSRGLDAPGAAALVADETA